MSKFDFNTQVAKDRKHHKERIAWLSGKNPKYSDGSSVSKHDAIRMLQVSQECLADESGMTGLNSAQ